MSAHAFGLGTRKLGFWFCNNACTSVLQYKTELAEMENNPVVPTIHVVATLSLNIAGQDYCLNNKSGIAAC